MNAEGLTNEAALMNEDAVMNVEPAPIRATFPGNRATATLVGGLYITGTLAGVASFVALGFTKPTGPDYLAEAAALGNRLVVSALFVLVMGLALAFIPILLYPILGATSRRIALGYLIFRGALETILTILLGMGSLVLSQLGRDYTPGGVEAAGARAAAKMLITVSSVISSVALPIVFLAGATMFYTILLRARLVPRWLAVWGLIAIVPYLTYAFLVALGIGPANAEALWDAPMALQEMVLAGWLIVSGFSGPTQPAPGAPDAVTASGAVRATMS